MERRTFTEFRSTGRRLEGYAAVFGSDAKIGDFVETIAPGAFRGGLDGDVLALLDHDLARSSAAPDRARCVCTWMVEGSRSASIFPTHKPGATWSRSPSVATSAA